MASELGSKEVVFCDFEFKADPGERQEPICLVAYELKSGKKHRIWEDELLTMRHPPYPVCKNTIFVAYYASAELHCHLALGWPLPQNVFDLYTEYRVVTNGMPTPWGRGLLGALAHFGLSTIDHHLKDEMRDLAMRGGPWTEQERTDLLEYCESDVKQLPAFFERILPRVDIRYSLVRGDYMKSVAQMEFNGIPIDVKTLRIIRENWENIIDQLISEVDQHYGVYEGRTFKMKKFEEWLSERKITWPRLESGQIDLKTDTFKEMAKAYPEILPLKELRSSLGRLRLNDLAVGSDGRNRCMLSAFKAKTGRNLPSSSKYIFGPSVWIRSLIQPGPGYGLAYVDWSQQEFGIAAVLSEDARMIEAYETGDPYLAFARQAGAIPAGGRKEDFLHVREHFKACALAVQYGMGAFSLAKKINQPADRAKELLAVHRDTYPQFWKWSDAVVDHAELYQCLSTTYGWQICLNGVSNTRSFRNFPMQANGADMLRLACCLVLRAGVKLCGPIHDAILIEAKVEDLDEKVVIAQRCMSDASALVLGGFRLRTDYEKVVYPQRYVDLRGKMMWDTVCKILGVSSG
jgi:hypothetical protein